MPPLRKRAEFAPLQRQIKAAEAEIARHSKRIAEIDAALADPQLYVRDAARAAALNKERAEIAGVARRRGRDLARRSAAATKARWRIDTP